MTSIAKVITQILLHPMVAIFKFNIVAKWWSIWVVPGIELFKKCYIYKSAKFGAFVRIVDFNLFICLTMIWTDQLSFAGI